MDDSLIHNLFDAVVSLHKCGQIAPARQVFGVLANQLFPNYVKMDYTPNGKEVSLGLEQGKIQMIKEYRARTDSTLIEAKNQCEDYFAKNNLVFKGY